MDQGRMAAPGLATVTVAKQNGMWDQPDRPDIPDEPPPEFAAALKQNVAARKNFDNLSPSHKRHYFGWIVMAKRPETRERRINEALKMLTKNQKLGLK